MKLLSKKLLSIVAVIYFSNVSAQNPQLQISKPTQPKIQVAILLDVSNSMDGLIDQAKAQLWNMVNTMGKVQCGNNATPRIEIALYEYGRSTNNARDGYVKRINGFIRNLDSLSQNLFKLTTNGGDEYCGEVIYKAIKELQWDASAESYKVIFIAGNEDFLQGSLHFSKACTEAKNKGVIVNTIYCGSRMDGIKEHWNLGGECGGGSFTNINTDARVEDIPTPYDSAIFAYNEKLNKTYLSYGANGSYYAANVAKQDELNVGFSKTAAIKRVEAKSNSSVYSNSNWDLVDAYTEDKNALKKIDKKMLADSLKNKSTADLEKIVTTKNKERVAIQSNIAKLNIQRESFIANAKAKKNNNKNNPASLESEIEKIIRIQVKRCGMKIK